MNGAMELFVINVTRSYLLSLSDRKIYNLYYKDEINKPFQETSHHNSV